MEMNRMSVHGWWSEVVLVGEWSRITYECEWHASIVRMVRIIGG